MEAPAAVAAAAAAAAAATAVAASRVADAGPSPFPPAASVGFAVKEGVVSLLRPSWALAAVARMGAKFV